ncbi:hypothetical protein [Kamptonema sp. PCC 6506]|uniref:hypothetical protein n=1 Tax=Kamptonema sp. PCC 6506 TaxID=272129 RepID=UPI0001DACCC8|nr:hypothetical protein [Kamptonema sp. PCC 6506]CBN58139.1 hypothetical protein OSCI_3640009 [Kamptonema sp. PCC 6506]
MSIRPRNGILKAPCPIIHIGVDPAEIDSSYIPIVEVLAAIFLTSLNEILRRTDRKGKPVQPFAVQLRSRYCALDLRCAHETNQMMVFLLSPTKIVLATLSKQSDGPQDDIQD